MKTKANSLRLLILAVVLSVVASSLRAQSVLNGSFEAPALSNGDYESGSGDNWTPSGDAFVFTNGFGNGTTPYGNQYEFFNPGVSDAQTISRAFTLNATYTLSLVASDIFGDQGQQLTIAVSGGATATQTFAIPSRSGGVSSGALSFAAYTLAFTPTINTAVTDTGISSFAVDNVQLSAPVLGVPEPSTWSLLGLGGAGLLGLTLYRRAPHA